MIVESPNKKATIKSFLPDNYTVEASKGHFVEILNSGDFNMGVDPSKDFEINLGVMASKKDVIKNLKTQVAAADHVVLATDPDREGELISYFLKVFLKIPESKYSRVTFHEITKSAVQAAIASPRKLDQSLIDAALSRWALDRIIGFRLSPLSRLKINCLSVGRCQSPAMILIATRELEIRNFVPEKYYELYLDFSRNNNPYRARYVGTDAAPLDPPRFKDRAIPQQIIYNCAGHEFQIKSIVSHDRKVSPKPPFTTSTFQQEANTRLGMSAKTAMDYAQSLFQGIAIAGEHKALVTYLRTDSTEMAPEFEEKLSTFVKNHFGPDYWAPLKQGKKQLNAQEGHECFRVIDLDMTPQKLSEHIQDQWLLKVYHLIYCRTVASHMAPAVITDIDYNIYNTINKFTMTTHSLKFDGYRAAYGYNDDEDLDKSFVDLTQGYILEDPALSIEQKETKPPKRYTEATLVKKLEDLGIGRPSTYATICDTILDTKRGYCNKNAAKEYEPTEKGIALSNWLQQNFNDIINLEYSAKMEESLDNIANGSLVKSDYLNDFYSGLCDIITKVDPDGNNRGKKGYHSTVMADLVCPNCGGHLVFKKGPYGTFYGCENYKNGCKYTQKF